MVTPQSFFILVLVSAILSVKSSIAEPIESCPRNAIIILTGKEGISFPRNSTWHRDGERLGCPCSFKTCLSFCQPWDNHTSGILNQVIRSIDENGVERNFSEENYHSFINDPCEIGWMAPSLMMNFSVFENGSIYAPDYTGGSLSNFEEYCLIEDQTSSGYLAKVCRPWVKKDYHEICSLVFGILMMLAIFIGYTIVPQLQRNLHGWIFRSYVASYIGTYVFALGVVYTTELRINPFWFSFFETTARYFGVCCNFWLTVMSVNIWRSFRDLRQIGYDSEEKIKRKFMWYAIYAWSGPVVLFAIAAAFMYSISYFYSDIVRKSFKLWGSVVLVTVALISNIFLYTSTALNIRRQKRETANLFNGVNPHSELDKQWFKLHFKLFMITGGHMATWIVWLIWPTRITAYLLGTTEMVQSSLTFFIFICKKQFKQALYDRFPGLRRLGDGQT